MQFRFWLHKSNFSFFFFAMISFYTYILCKVEISFTNFHVYFVLGELYLGIMYCI